MTTSVWVVTKFQQDPDGEWPRVHSVWSTEAAANELVETRNKGRGTYDPRFEYDEVKMDDPKGFVW